MCKILPIFMVAKINPSLKNITQYLGTCFYVGNNKFATASHVTGNANDELIILTNVFDSKGYQDFTTTDIRKHEGFKVELCNYNPLHDISILKITDPTIFTKIDLSYTLDSTDNLSIGTEVIHFGFPHADQYRHVLTYQKNSVGALVLLGNKDQKLKHIILNNQTRPGQSGGPVFSNDLSKIYAMILGGFKPKSNGSITISGIDLTTIHQTTHAISAEYIKDMLNE